MELELDSRRIRDKRRSKLLAESRNEYKNLLLDRSRFFCFAMFLQNVI